MIACVPLPDVTLCCIDTKQPLAALRALRLSQVRCDFAESLLLTDRTLEADGIEVRQIPPITSVLDYSRLVMTGLAEHIRTNFVLLVQWDGWILDGMRWETGFRSADYIGAPWEFYHDAMTVGNGGFSLRSRKLLHALAALDLPPANPEDLAICREYRHALERLGIRFAGPDIAARFAFEWTFSDRQTFGFHGAHNFWRTVPDHDLPALLDLLPPETLDSWGMQRLLISYLIVGRREAADMLLARMSECSVENVVIRNLLHRYSQSPSGART
jgi:hypothetical protein